MDSTKTIAPGLDNALFCKTSSAVIGSNGAPRPKINEYLVNRPKLTSPIRI